LHLKYHLILSSIVSFIFFLLTKSVYGSVACFLVGIFIDLDHWIDFWIFKKKIVLSANDFFKHFREKKYTRAYIFFHSIELLPVILVLGNLILGKIITYGIALGFVSHIIADYIGNGRDLFDYFFVYRIYKRFDIF